MYSPALALATGLKPMNQTLYDQVCEYVFYALYTDIELNFLLTPTQRAACRAFEDGWVFERSYCSEQIWQVIASEFTQQLLEIAQMLKGEYQNLE